MSTTPGAADGSQRNSLELDAEHAQRVPGAEQGGVPPTQVKLKERQKFFEEAFQQDMEQYLSTGYLQITERREPIGSMSSMEVNVDMLEQMDLMDMSDHEALDVFLHSGGEDNSAAACNRVQMWSPSPQRSASRCPHKPSSAIAVLPLVHLYRLCQPGHGGREEEEEEEEDEQEEERGRGVGGPRRRRPPVVVTLDEEEVHVDTALVDRAEEQSSTDCEESRPKD